MAGNGIDTNGTALGFQLIMTGELLYLLYIVEMKYAANTTASENDMVQNILKYFYSAQKQ